MQGEQGAELRARSPERGRSLGWPSGHALRPYPSRAPAAAQKSCHSLSKGEKPISNATINSLLNGSTLVEPTRMRKAMALALIGQQHCLVVGPKGVAKTEFHAELFNALNLPKDEKAVISGYKGAGEEILLNYLSPKGLEDDEFRYLPGPSILNRKLIYIDEVEKLARLTQQILLQVMQSRRFSRAGIDHAVPLDTLFAGGNGAPEDPAVRDRFGIQVPLDKTPELMRQVAVWAVSEVSATRQEADSISWHEVLMARQRAKAIRINEAATELMIGLSLEFDLSPRRLAQVMVPVCQANALLHETETVSPAIVLDAAPFVVLHEGELTVSRFDALQARFSEAAQKAQKAAALKKLVSTVKAHINAVEGATELADGNLNRSTLKAVQAALRELRSCIEGLPSPDSCQEDVAKIVQQMNDAAQSAYRNTLERLGLSF